MAMQGRVHFYEGYTMQEITLPVRVMRAMGCHSLVMSNAVGGMNPHWGPGEIVVVIDGQDDALAAGLLMVAGAGRLVAVGRLAPRHDLDGQLGLPGRLRQQLRRVGLGVERLGEDPVADHLADVVPAGTEAGHVETLDFGQMRLPGATHGKNLLIVRIVRVLEPVAAAQTETAGLP